MKYAFFVLLRATPAWLALSRERRGKLGAEHLQPLVQRAAPLLTMRYFDADAFTAACSDVMLIETDDPSHHYFFMEALRDTPLLSAPYFEVVQIIPAVEDGFKAYDSQLAG